LAGATAPLSCSKTSMKEKATDSKLNAMALKSVNRKAA
jgi:hypothetical protein